MVKFLRKNANVDEVASVVKRAVHRSISSYVQGKTLISNDFTLADLIEKFQNGWRFRTAHAGRLDKDSELIIPPENENTLHISIISKTGLLTFFSRDFSSKAAPREDEYIMILEKEMCHLYQKINRRASGYGIQ